MSRNKTEKNMRGNDVICIDDGPNIDEDYGEQFPRIYGACLTRNYQGNTISLPSGCERKGDIFSEKEKNRAPLTKIANRGTELFNRNNDFYFVTLPREDLDNAHNREHYYHMHAVGVARLILKFYLTHDLNPDKTVVAFDQMDNRIIRGSDFLCRVADFQIPHLMLRKKKGVKRASKEHPLIKRVDRLLYHVAGLRYRGDIENWPNKYRRLRDDEDHIVALMDRVHRKKLPNQNRRDLLDQYEDFEIRNYL